MSPTVALKEVLYDNTMASAPELVLRGEGDAVQCVACGHRCVIKPGRSGVCRVRFNADGQLRAPAGYVAGVQIDPIEKKPFFHAYPGRDALSFGMLGCDFHCSYCQNWVTSQALRDESAVARPSFVTPEQVIEFALRDKVPVMVSTYNEPLITADWAVEIFKLARAEGIVCGFVSNGNATPEVLEFIRPYVDLYKVDLKGFDDLRYRSLGGVLSNVLDTIKLLRQMAFWVEVVTLVVPGFNDGDDELRGIAEFLAGVSPDIPWHITAFHPDYKMTDPPRTTADALVRAAEFGRVAGLRYIYAGNLPGAVGSSEHTACPGCGEVLIRRFGFMVMENHMAAGGACPTCERKIPGVWEEHPPRRTTGAGVPLPVRLS
jgi:pyruvate formate lyase activating enzyme